MYQLTISQKNVNYHYKGVVGTKQFLKQELLLFKGVVRDVEPAWIYNFLNNNNASDYRGDWAGLFWKTDRNTQTLIRKKTENFMKNIICLQNVKKHAYSQHQSVH